MKQEELTFIERELEITLPESYKKAAAEAKIARTKHPSRFYDDPYNIIKTNRRLREKGLSGQPLRKNHFVLGYEKDGGEYYFIDTKNEDGCVYLADRTKGWRYSPDNLSNNTLKAYSTIDKYVNYMCDLSEMTDEKTSQPEMTDDEKQKMILDFFIDMDDELRKNNQ